MGSSSSNHLVGCLLLCSCWKRLEAPLLLLLLQPHGAGISHKCTIYNTSTSR
jgi:hypothetical protein